jgi:hypothetical protein
MYKLRQLLMLPSQEVQRKFKKKLNKNSITPGIEPMTPAY